MYEEVDLQTASRFGLLGWVIAFLLAAAFMPFFPPTEAIGGAGWFVALIGFAVVGGRIVPVIRRGTTGTALLAMSFTAIALIATLDWLVGPEGPYHNLYLMVVLSTALIQPPRRLAVVLAALAVARCLPAIYEHDAFRAGDAAMQILLWIGLAAFVYALIQQLRSQRHELEHHGAAAVQSARSDPLTGLGNRRAFDDDARAELDRHRRTGVALSLAVIDLDAFKPINDDYGHAAGDEVLVAVADALRAETRAIDGCYRWGGDEFALILPGTGRGAAKIACRRIAERLERESPHPEGAPIRFSAGVAQFADHETVDQVLAAADAELFDIKRARHSSGVASAGSRSG